MTEQNGMPSGQPDGPSFGAGTPEPWQAPTSRPQPPLQNPALQNQAPAGYGPPQYSPPPNYGPYGQPTGYQAPAPSPYQAGGYPPGGYSYAQPARQGTNGFAVAALVLGIVWVYWLGSVLALIFGYVALSQIKKYGGGGRGLAIAGVVLGWLGIAALAILIIAMLAIGHEATTMRVPSN